MSLEIKVHNSTGCLKNMDSLDLQGLHHILTFPTTFTHSPLLVPWTTSVANLNIAETMEASPENYTDYKTN